MTNEKIDPRQRRSGDTGDDQRRSHRLFPLTTIISALPAHQGLISTMTDAASTAAIPSNARARQLRACLLCSIIQSPADFKRNGCPNCEEIMQMKQSSDRVLSCTTTHFEGVIAAIDPEASWVARWQRTCTFTHNDGSVL